MEAPSGAAAQCCQHHAPRVSEAVEDYAKAMRAPIAPETERSRRAIAHRLRVTSDSASSMIKRLAEPGLGRQRPLPRPYLSHQKVDGSLSRC